MQPKRLGGHLGVEEGLRYVVMKARALGMSAVQIILGSGQKYDPIDIPDKVAEEWRKMTYGIATYVHLPFVINPCESLPRRVTFYKQAVKRHCVMASSLGARAVVMHPGYKKQLPQEIARKNLVRFVDEVWDDGWNLNLLLETDSGSKNGSAIGTPEVILQTLEALDHNQVGMCLDTAHMYARGTNLWNAPVLERFLKTYGRSIRLVHLNVPDEDVGFGSFRDRHNIAFEDREGWKHENLIQVLTARYDCILERRSIAVQEADMQFVEALRTPSK